MTLQSIIVGGHEIPSEEIAAEAQHHPAPSAEAAWTAAAEALAVRRLLLDEAERQGLEPTAALDDAGRALMREDVLIDALLLREIRTPEADEATCRRFYERHSERFISPTLVEAAHILIAADPADDFAMGLATGDARNLIRRLQSDPEMFAQLAREKSACPSREQGGNLGQVTRRQMVRPFEEALFALPEHTLCPHPVKTRFGVHVIRSGRRVEGVQLPFEVVRMTIADYLEEASYRRAVAQYVAVLAERAGVSGLALGGTDGTLVQ